MVIDACGLGTVDNFIYQMEPENPPPVEGQDEEAMLVNLPASAVVEPGDANEAQ